VRECRQRAFGSETEWSLDTGNDARTGPTRVADQALRLALAVGDYDRVVTDLESGIATRPATSADSDFLWEMIRLAAVWDNPDRYTVEELQARPKVASYLDRWEERGIFGLVVVDGGRSVGAAWCSFAESAEEIFGFSASDVPVMVMALEAGYRDRHLGRRLLTELMTLARSRGHQRMSLEVDAGNERGRHLYERLGFREERVEPDGAAVMVADV